MQEFVTGMGNLLIALGAASVVGLALGGLLIYFLHIRPVSGDEEQ